MKVFWMLYAEEREGPTYKHATEKQARAEAERLAKTLRLPVYLLEAVAKCEMVSIKWEEQEGEK